MHVFVESHGRGSHAGIWSAGSKIGLADYDIWGRRGILRNSIKNQHAVIQAIVDEQFYPVAVIGIDIGAQGVDIVHPVCLDRASSVSIDQSGYGIVLKKHKRRRD